MFKSMGTEKVTVIKRAGESDEERLEVEGHIQARKGFFAVDAPIHDGDIIEAPDPRGGSRQLLAETVDIFNVGSSHVRHMEVTWGRPGPIKLAPVRRLEIENLHSGIVAASSELFVDGHNDQAVFEAFKAVEERVRRLASIDSSGRELMA